MSDVPATRRFDPDRRDRLVDVTIDVLADHGVAGTTHRRVAAAADVPLGSLTYHFDSLTELLTEAFTRHAERMAALFAGHFAGIVGRADLLDAAVTFVHGGAGASRRDRAVAYELYLAALRDPTLRAVTEAWMRSSRATLERLVDPVTAGGLDGAMEGLTMHSILSTEPPSPEQTRAVLARVLQVAG